jgi:LuxR family maltose regulon positive regulatory protein
MAPSSLALVIDDIHLIDDPAVLDTLVAVLEGRPHPLHVVLVGRQAPRLAPLARWRVREEVVELAGGAWHVPGDEALRIVETVAPRPLDPGAVAEIVLLSEGWMTGLVLGARAGTEMGSSPAGDLTTATRSYLVEEVLNQQPAELGRFLMATATAGDILVPELCDLLAGRDDSAHLLAELAQGGAFTEHLDGHPSYYRYHPLFAEALRAEAREADGAAYRRAEQLAAGWYWSHGVATRALEQSLLSRDLRKAARLTMRLLPDVGPTVASPELMAWPVRGSPPVGAATLPPMPAGPPGRAGLTAEQRATVLLVQAASAAFGGHAESALALIDEASDVLGDRAVALPLPGFAAIAEVCCLGALGCIRDAEVACRAGLKLATDGKLHRADLGGVWAEALVAAGYVRWGRAEADAALEIAREEGGLHRRSRCATLRARARAHLEASEIAEAEALADEALALTEDSGMLLDAVPTFILRAELALARDRPAEALHHLRPATGLYESRVLGPQLAGPLALTRFRAWLALGDFERAALEVESCTPGPAQSQARARLDLERGDPELAQERLWSPTPHLPRHAVEYNVLLARIWAGADAARATKHANRALQLAHRYGIRRAVKEAQHLVPAAARERAEPLSPAELRVVRLLPSHASTREIAEQLFVSRETVRTHIKHIYRKLSAHDRTSAVANARIHGLL